MLGWTALDLAQNSGVAVSTLRRIEVQSGVPACHPRTLLDLKRTFEAAGIEFIGTPENEPGVKLRSPPLKSIDA
jgi:hypothetical protein